MEKRKRSPWEILCITGLPWLAIFTAACIAAARWWTEELLGREFRVRSPEDLKGVAAMAACAWAAVLAKNLLWLAGGRRKIGLLTWLDRYSYEPPEKSGRKLRAEHPDIPDEYLSDSPDGLVLGKKGRKFVRVPLKRGGILNAIIMGAPGCGKSVLLLTMLIHQLHRRPCGDDEGGGRMTFYVTDCKPELAMKSSIIGEKTMVHYMDPQDRGTYGWDVYYSLSPGSTDDEVLAELDTIARALIDEGKSERNAFFYQHARTIMKAVLLWQFRLGRSFMEGLDFLMGGSLAEVIGKAIEGTADRPGLGLVRKLLSPYTGKEGEAFEGIELSFRQQLDIFTQEGIAYFLDGNPRKASPLDLEKGENIFLAIQETRLDECRSLLRLVTMQIMRHCSQRPEGSHMLTFIIDEAARIGIDWTAFLATSRSRQINTILAFQSIGQAQGIWGRDGTRTLLELCRVIEVLSCSDSEMARLLSDWAGMYKDEGRSVITGGKRGESYTTSYDDRRVLAPADIMGLQESGEAVAFVKGRYMRMDVLGARYYNIPELLAISEKCLEENRGRKHTEKTAPET